MINLAAFSRHMVCVLDIAHLRSVQYYNILWDLGGKKG